MLLVAFWLALDTLSSVYLPRRYFNFPLFPSFFLSSTTTFISKAPPRFLQENEPIDIYRLLFIVQERFAPISEPIVGERFLNEPAARRREFSISCSHRQVKKVFKVMNVFSRAPPL